MEKRDKKNRMEEEPRGKDKSSHSNKWTVKYSDVQILDDAAFSEADIFYLLLG